MFCMSGVQVFDPEVCTSNSSTAQQNAPPRPFFPFGYFLTYRSVTSHRNMCSEG